MAEYIPLNPESATKTLLKTLDTLFEAAACGTYEADNGVLLKDIGLVVAHKVDEEDTRKDAVLVANWNSLDVVEIIRAENDDVDISLDLPFPVRFQMKHRDMLGRNLQLPMTIGQQTFWISELTVAVTDNGVLVPWIVVGDSDAQTLFFPPEEECREMQPEVMQGWFKLLEVRTLIDLYDEDDPYMKLFS